LLVFLSRDNAPAHASCWPSTHQHAHRWPRRASTPQSPSVRRSSWSESSTRHHTHPTRTPQPGRAGTPARPTRGVEPHPGRELPPAPGQRPPCTGSTAVPLLVFDAPAGMPARPGCGPGVVAWRTGVPARPCQHGLAAVPSWGPSWGGSGVGSPAHTDHSAFLSEPAAPGAPRSSCWCS
jgi:hypothetical protein